MSDLSGRVAVVTGAASGIGFALAKKFVSHDMKVVLADIEEDALERATDELNLRGTALAVPTDVSLEESVEDLRRQAEALGPVYLLCNNAGVGGPPATASEGSINTWQWVLGVNLWGVIHGLRAFLPAMLERDHGHIVNTASVAGLLPMPFNAPYAASKHAVVGITMSVHHELAMLGSNVRVSVLCPGWLRTNILDARRNWPERLGPPPTLGPSQVAQILDAMSRHLVDTGMDPDLVAEQVLDSVQTDRFWILPNTDELAPFIKETAAGAVEGRNPPLPLPE